MRPDPASPLRFESRRSFLQKSLLVTAGIGAGGVVASAAEYRRARTGDSVAWYRRAYRWGQTNITEVDPTRYDIAWWRQHWKRTRVQGVVVNAGGIFAYYPSKFPLHRRPDALGDRDLFGELSRARTVVSSAPGLVRRERGGQAVSRRRDVRLVCQRKAGNEPVPSGERHPVLRGFGETDILPFGGVLEPLRVDADAQVLATFVPSFPIYPPETAWMREPRTTIPGVIVRELSNGARISFLPADLDRRFSRDNLPDHGNLLANLVRWTARDRIPLSVEGPGLMDCHLYQQREKLIVHFVNLTSAATWRAPIHELIAVGPLRVRIDLPKGVKAHRARSLVSTAKLRVRTSAKAVEFELPRVLDHEVIVIG